MENQLLEVPDTNDLKNPPPEPGGWSFEIAGECLKIGDSQWSDEQRSKGITVGCVYLTSTDEEMVLDELGRAGGSPGKALAFQARRSISTIDGKKIRHVDKVFIWEALGPLGRGMCQMALQRANSPSEEAAKRFTASFRVTA